MLTTNVHIALLVIESVLPVIVKYWFTINLLWAPQSGY